MADKKPLPWLKNSQNLCLASASPRRLELLQQAGIKPTVFSTAVDETHNVGESPNQYVQRMAVAKAQAGAASGLTTILAADTIVVVDGEILGKPKDAMDAEKMLAKLSNRQHQVISAIALQTPNQEQIQTRIVTTKVWFKKISRAEIGAYVATKEPLDKAGSYGIQGFGAFMVEKIEGSYSGVVGLPLHETLQLLTNYN